MAVLGIIAEYNPLHTGHIYHLEAAKRLTGASQTVVVMSGDYVQRGEPAVTDKYRRTRMALAAGADVVLELPVTFASGSAERFASGAVEILDRLNVVTDLVYGCETAEDALLQRAAGILITESGSFRDTLRSGLRSGLPFPQARALALEEELPGSRELLGSPNNILAVEYRKALLLRGSTIRASGIPRAGSSYHAQALAPQRSYSSATALREALLARRQTSPETVPEDLPWLELAAWLPEETRRQLEYVIGPDDLTLLLHHALRSFPAEDVCRIQDMAPEIESRLADLSGELLTFRETAKLLKRCNIAHTRINRALLHLVLGLTETPAGEIPAVRLLGFRRGTPLMRLLQDASSIPIITKLADADPAWFAQDVRASELYRALVWQKTGIRLEGEYRSHPVIY